MAYNIPSAQIEGYRGLMVYLGLGSPISRAFVAGATVASIQYITKTPKDAYDEDGAIKPWLLMSPQNPEATDKHFLILPLGAAITVFLFT